MNGDHTPPLSSKTMNLREAFQKYGRHTDGCRTRDWTTGDKSWDDATCDCGLREAVSAVSEDVVFVGFQSPVLQSEPNEHPPAAPQRGTLEPTAKATGEGADTGVSFETSGYQDAFYAIGELLGLTAMPISPKEAFETRMLPRLRQLIVSAPAPPDWARAAFPDDFPVKATGEPT